MPWRLRKALANSEALTGKLRRSKTNRYVALTHDQRTHARDVDWSSCKITNPHARPKINDAEIAEEVSILHECAKNLKPPLSEDRPERQLLAE